MFLTNKLLELGVSVIWLVSIFDWFILPRSYVTPWHHASMLNTNYSVLYFLTSWRLILPLAVMAKRMTVGIGENVISGNKLLPRISVVTLLKCFCTPLTLRCTGCKTTTIRPVGSIEVDKLRSMDTNCGNIAATWLKTVIIWRNLVGAQRQCCQVPCTLRTRYYRCV